MGPLLFQVVRWVIILNAFGPPFFVPVILHKTYLKVSYPTTII